MANIGPTELIIVLVIALLILGPKRLPAAARFHGPRDPRVRGLDRGTRRLGRRRDPGRERRGRGADAAVMRRRSAAKLIV